MRVAFSDFVSESARRILREQGIDVRDGDNPEELVVSDPDGIAIALSAASVAR